MSEIEKTILDEMQKCGEDFLIPLKARDGFDRHAYERLCRAIRTCGDHCNDSEVLPKRAVSMFVEMHPFLVGCEPAYSGDEKQQILDAELELTEIMLQCASIAPEEGHE